MPYAPDLSRCERFGLYTLTLTVAENGTEVFSELYHFSRIAAGDGELEIMGAATHVMRGINPYETVFPLMKAAGLTYFRDDFDWSIMEREKGVRTITDTWRSGVDMANEIGLKPLMILDYSNSFYDPINPTKDAWLDGYVEYCKTLVTEFKGQAGAYEIWNEWNINFGGIDNRFVGSEYYAMTAFAAAKAIKEIDPDTPLLIGCSSGADAKWLEGIVNYVDPITEESLYDLCDGISFHPYIFPDDPDSGSLYDGIASIAKLMEGREEKELWITEIGWPSSGAWSSTELESAAYLVRMTTNFMSYEGLIDKVIWYQFHDYDNGMESAESYFGLLSWPEDHRAVPYHAKPGYATLSAMNAKLGNATYVDSPDFGEDIIAHRFRGDGGGDVIVAWCRNTNKLLNITAGQPVTISDMYGNVVSETADGIITAQISDHPIYIEMADASAVNITANGFFAADTEFDAAPGNTVTLSVTRQGTSKALDGAYKITLPEGWTAENTAFAADAEEDSITITIPADCEAGLHTVSVVPTIQSGEYGRMDFRITVTDGAFLINPAYTDGAFKLSVTVQNGTNTEAISGKIAITSPAAFAGEQTFSTAAGENATLLFDLPTELGHEIYDVEAKVTLDGGESVTVTKSVSFLYALQAISDIRIDGIIDLDGEWKGAMKYEMGKDDWVGFDNANYPGNTASVYFKWDEENLYIAAEVYDKVHYQPEEFAYIHEGDSMILVIEPGKQKAEGAFHYTELGFSVGEHDRYFRWKWESANPGKDAAGSYFEFVRDNGNGISYYEVSVPWAVILPEGRFEGYDNIGLTVAFNERRGNARDGWLGKEFGGYVNGGEKCSVGRFGDLVLAKMEHTHEMTKHEGDATCVTAGNVTYYTCSDPYCEGIKYGDEAGRTILSETDGVPDPNNHVNTHVEGEIKATRDAKGYTGDTVCDDCGWVERGETVPVKEGGNTALAVMPAALIAVFLPLFISVTNSRRRRREEEKKEKEESKEE